MTHTKDAHSLMAGAIARNVHAGPVTMPESREPNASASGAAMKPDKRKKLKE